MVPSPFAHDLAPSDSLHAIHDHHQCNSHALDHYGADLRLQLELIDCVYSRALRQWLLDHGKNTNGGLLPAGNHPVNHIHSRSS